jgi:DNA-binding MarR family transcriptional regulator
VNSQDAELAQIWKLLFEIVLDGEKRLAGHFAMHNLTTPQFYVLKTLIEKGGTCPIGRLARLHGLTLPTMSGLVTRLEAQTPPLVARAPDAADRRSIIVAITAEGRAKFDAVQSNLFDYLRAIVSMLPAQDRQTIIDYLSRYVDLIVRGMPMNPE